MRLVASAPPQHLEWSWFCGHCAASADAPAANARVCRSCGLGLLLEGRGDALPTVKDAFVVVDSELRVQAVSGKAEPLLDVTEDAAINKPVTQLLVPADAEAGGPSRFARAVASVMGSDDPIETFVRPWNTFGVRMRVKVAPCGPPRAALVLLDIARPRLRSV